MARVKFLKPTVHPDYGQIEKGEVLAVPQEYLRDYLELGIAQECDDEEVTRKEPEGATQGEVSAARYGRGGPGNGAASSRSLGGEQPGGRSRGR
jgi:hypothetical protein